MKTPPILFIAQRNIIVLTCLGSLFFSSCQPNKSVSMEPTFTKEGELTLLSDTPNQPKASIDIELAEDEWEIREGLMYRKSMETRQGMLFIMGTEERQSFWMLNTYIPLDIIFADRQGTIVSIATNVQPHVLDPVSSVQPAFYVLEVNAGFTAQYNIQVGHLFEWKRM